MSKDKASSVDSILEFLGGNLDRPKRKKKDEEEEAIPGNPPVPFYPGSKSPSPLRTPGRLDGSLSAPLV